MADVPDDRVAEPEPGARLDGRKTRRQRGESLVEYVRNAVLQDIIEGRLKPGSMVRLPDLAKRCGVSRTPAREALSLLAREGLVMSIPYKGYLIRPIEPSDVHDVFFIRTVLESAAAELAAEKLSAADLQRLRDLVEHHGPERSEETMTVAYDEHSHEFHRVIVAAAGSPRLLSSFEGVYNDVRRMQYAGIGSPRPDLIHEEHRQILDALSRGDAAESRALMIDHLTAVRSRALHAWVGLEQRDPPARTR